MDILIIVLPVLMMLVLGKLFAIKQIVSRETVTGIKGLISDVMLPVVIFNALLTAEFNARSLMLSLTVYAIFTLFFLAGLKFLRPLFRFGMSPFLLIGAEGGMIGYSLYTSLYGADALSTLMQLDLGNILFAFTFFIVIIKIANSKNANTGEVVMQSLKTPLVIVVAVSLVLNLLGVGRMLEASAFSGLYHALVNMITAPLTTLILLSVGYELAFDGSIMKDVVKVSVVRMVMQFVIGVILLVLARPLITTRALYVAVILYVCLPPQFITPIFIQDEEEAKFAATTLSFYTMITIAAYVMIALFVPLV